MSDLVKYSFIQPLVSVRLVSLLKKDKKEGQSHHELVSGEVDWSFVILNDQGHKHFATNNS